MTLIFGTDGTDVTTPFGSSQSRFITHTSLIDATHRVPGTEAVGNT